MFKSIKKLGITVFAFLCIAQITTVSALEKAQIKYMKTSNNITLRISTNAIYTVAAATRWKMGNPSAAITSGSGTGAYCNWTNKFENIGTKEIAYQYVTGIVPNGAISYSTERGTFTWTYDYNNPGAGLQ